METTRSNHLKHSNKDCANFHPPGFQPGANHVIIGRGKRCYKHEGNQKLRRIVHAKLEEYSNAPSKSEKSQMLASIITAFRNGLPPGGFIKQDLIKNLWFDVGDFLAKEKVSQTFRDVLKEKCKNSSSKKRKFKKSSIKSKGLRDQNSQVLLQLNESQSAIDALSMEIFNTKTVSLESSITYDADPFMDTSKSDICEKRNNLLVNSMEMIRELEDINANVLGVNLNYDLPGESASFENIYDGVIGHADYWETFMSSDSDIESDTELDNFDFTISEENERDCNFSQQRFVRNKINSFVSI